VATSVEIDCGNSEVSLPQNLTVPSHVEKGPSDRFAWEEIWHGIRKSDKDLRFISEMFACKASDSRKNITWSVVVAGCLEDQILTGSGEVHWLKDTGTDALQKWGDGQRAFRPPST
jgi:hypothetical protein